ncbi:MAG TPA: DUF6049 family protein [Streptosporangiaceae bacterium]|nr:DUF6049 family protein [Streptosporangiaceae bacterium]
MHGWLAATLRRRTLSVAAAFVTAALAAAPAAHAAQTAHADPAAPAQTAATGGLSIKINAMNPPVAQAGATVNLRGTITNHTRQIQAGLQVQLSASATHFTARDALKSYMSRGDAPGLVQAGDSFPIAASMPPGSTVSWSASFQVGAVGISTFGVYPVTAQLQAVATLGVLSSDHTLLPYWPGSRTAANLQSRLKISWLWPLVDQPHHRACTALTDNSLAAELAPDGRLSALLAAGSGHEDADLTWMVDPALLSDVATMSSRYQVGGRPNCTGAVYQPASHGAQGWLTGLRKVTAAQRTILTPYANVDMAALVHQGLTKDLAAAYQLGDAVGNSVLRGTFGHEIAWPAGGTADLSVLTNLAAADSIGTVVLTSSEMPVLADAGSFQPDDAVTKVRVAGLPVNVLLSDSTLTGVLRAGDTSSGRLPKSTEFDVRQRFLAETAMIAAEAPESARTIVVAPPYDWSPSQGLADDLLDETVSAPWLAPAPLASLSSAPDTQRGVARQPLPSAKKSPGELSADYMTRVRATGDALAAYKSMLYKPSPGYVRFVSEAMIATESAAWRGRGESRGESLIDSLSGYIESAEKKAEIITSAQVPMGGSAGLVPFTIQNGLQHQTIQVRVIVSVDNTLGRTSQLTVGRFQDLLLIPPQQTRLVKLPVSSAPQGSTAIHVSLAAADGTPLPSVKHATLTVLSTRYGRAILFLIGAAIGVLVLTSVFRGVRRRLHGDSNPVSEEADPPGSVVTGISGTRYPTEAPDDLADARRWVDDA